MPAHADDANTRKRRLDLLFENRGKVQRLLPFAAKGRENEIPRSALRIFAAVAAPSIKSVGLLPGKLSANKACKATASLVLPTKSRTSGSAYFPTPTKVERKAISLQMVHTIAEKSKNSAQQRRVQRWVQNSQALH
jgi:hypothetical protein